MALVTCAECGRKVSTLAHSCPHCGAPTAYSVKQAEGGDEEERSSRDYSGLITKLVIILVVLVLGYLFIRPHIRPVEQKVIIWAMWAKRLVFGDPKVPQQPICGPWPIRGPIDQDADSPSPGNRVDPLKQTMVPENARNSTEQETPSPTADLAKTMRPTGSSSVTPSPAENAVVKKTTTEQANEGNGNDVRTENKRPALFQKNTPPNGNDAVNEKSKATDQPLIPGPGANAKETAQTTAPPKIPGPAPSGEKPDPARLANPVIPKGEQETVVAEVKIKKPVKKVEDPDVQKLNTLSTFIQDARLQGIQTLQIRKGGKLIVIVNEDWDLLSCEQKQAAAKKLYQAWEDLKGTDMLFQTRRGKTVGRLNYTALKLRGEVSFFFTGCE